MQLYLLNDYGNVSNLYSLTRSPKKALKEVQTIIASVIGTLSDEIILTLCGTESDN